MALKFPMAQGDPFKTLFVARISYDATEKKLRRDFEEYGPIKSIRLVHEKRSGESCAIRMPGKALGAVSPVFTLHCCGSVRNIYV